MGFVARRLQQRERTHNAPLGLRAAPIMHERRGLASCTRCSATKSKRAALLLLLRGGKREVGKKRAWRGLPNLFSRPACPRLDVGSSASGARRVERREALGVVCAAAIARGCVCGGGWERGARKKVAAAAIARGFCSALRARDGRRASVDSDKQRFFLAVVRSISVSARHSARGREQPECARVTRQGAPTLLDR